MVGDAARGPREEEHEHCGKPNCQDEIVQQNASGCSAQKMAEAAIARIF
jgi:hypothetical protein